MTKTRFGFRSHSILDLEATATWSLKLARQPNGCEVMQTKPFILGLIIIENTEFRRKFVTQGKVLSANASSNEVLSFKIH